MKRRTIGAIGVVATAATIAAGLFGSGLVVGAGEPSEPEIVEPAASIRPGAVEASATIGSVTFRLGPKDGAPGETCLLIADSTPVTNPVTVPVGAGTCGPTVTREQGAYFARSNGDDSVSYWGMAPTGTVAVQAGEVRVPLTDGFFVATTQDTSGVLILQASDGTARTVQLK